MRRRGSGEVKLASGWREQRRDVPAANRCGPGARLRRWRRRRRVGEPRTRSPAAARSSDSYSPARQASSRAVRRGRSSGTSRLAGVRARSPSRIRRSVGSAPSRAPTLPSQTTRGPVLRQVLSAPAPAESARRTIARDGSQASAGRDHRGLLTAAARRPEPLAAIWMSSFMPASLCPGTVHRLMG
jgi:hypothetical protein